MSNTMGSIFGMLAIATGVIVGDAVAGGDGARIGFVGMGILAFFTPWRRTLLARVRKWQQQRVMRELGLTEGDDPGQFKS